MGERTFSNSIACSPRRPVMRVQHGKEDVGHLQALFVSMHARNRGPLCFRLSGRAWEGGEIDWARGVLHVRPADRGRVPSWLGLPGTLSTRLSLSRPHVPRELGHEAQLCLLFCWRKGTTPT